MVSADHDGVGGSGEDGSDVRQQKWDPEPVVGCLHNIMRIRKLMVMIRNLMVKMRKLTMMIRILMVMVRKAMLRKLDDVD